MNDDDKELLKNLDLLMNLELIQNEKDWELIQTLNETEDKVDEATEELKLEEEQ